APLPRAAESPQLNLLVVPAKAGTHLSAAQAVEGWIPACAGMTVKGEDIMSVQSREKRVSATQIQGRKGGDKIVCLTAYTAPVARLLDEACYLLLVGDSLAMTVYGFDSTLPVTLDMMIAHGAAVVRATN